MGAILQFAERLADDQDWTASERAQLREVGAQLRGVDVVFGRSEIGDPWCVVTDEAGEVLLHVARIGGDFVVHATRQDEVVHDEDLWTAAKRLLGDMLKDRRGVLLTFPPEALGQAGVLAFLFAAAMHGDFDRWIPASHSEPPRPAEPGPGGHAPPPQAHTGDETAGHASAAEQARAGEGGGAVKLAAARAPAEAQAPAPAEPAASAADAPPAPSAPEPAAPPPAPPSGAAAHATHAPQAQPGPRAGGGGQTAQASFTTTGGQGFTTATTGGGGDGPGGAEPERSAEPPRLRPVQGGDGDDRLLLDGKVLAAGGAGADAFVVALSSSSASAVAGEPVLLGVVADFDAAAGDRLELAGAGVVVSDRAEADVLAVLRGQAGGADAPVVAGRRIGYDVDGDGREDAYVLITGGAGAWVHVPHAAPAGASAPADDLLF